MTDWIPSTNNDFNWRRPSTIVIEPTVKDKVGRRKATGRLGKPFMTEQERLEKQRQYVKDWKRRKRLERKTEKGEVYKDKQ